MRTYRLECEMIVKKQIDEVFAFFEEPRNLAKITPPWMSFQLISTGAIEMKTSAEIEYHVRWLGFRMYWKTLITLYSPPHLFVDEQANGPYRLWRHKHIFEQIDQGVRAGDSVAYAMPFGWAGRAAHALVVKRQLLTIFQYRQRKLSEIFGGETIETRAPAIRSVQSGSN